jgi:hypothetical protein
MRELYNTCHPPPPPRTNLGVECRYEAPRVVRQKNMVMSPAGPGTNCDCAGEAQQQFIGLAVPKIINLENSNCKVCRNVAKPSTFDSVYFQNRSHTWNSNEETEGLDHISVEKSWVLMRTGLTSLDKKGIKYESDWTKQRFQWLTILTRICGSHKGMKFLNKSVTIKK